MASTPKKVIARSKRGRKPKQSQDEENVNDFCRVCKCCFNHKYGKGNNIAYLNILKPSETKEYLGLVIANLCSAVGIPVFQSPDLSARMCRPCCRKVKNMSESFHFISTAVNVPRQNLKQGGGEDLLNANSDVSVKRLLPTTISTPDRSPSSRKFQRIQSPKTKSRTVEKSLFESNVVGDREEAKIQARAQTDAIKSCMNIDDLNVSTCTAPQTSRVKVLIVSPNGDTTSRSPEDRNTISVIRNIAIKNWQTAANAIIAHEQLIPSLLVALNRVVDKEFKAFSKSKTVLKSCEPEQLASFSNKQLLGPS